MLLWRSMKWSEEDRSRAEGDKHRDSETDFFSCTQIVYIPFLFDFCSEYRLHEKSGLNLTRIQKAWQLTHGLTIFARKSRQAKILSDGTINYESF